MFMLGKFSLIIVTRCNLRCKLCCEYVPQNTPFPDMTLEEERNILDALFSTVDHVKMLHLTGGGEPFLHPQLAEMIHTAMLYSNRFDQLMLFTNSTLPLSDSIIQALCAYKDKIFIQLSQYGINKEREQATAKLLLDHDIKHRVEKYYGDDQPFGGWVNFGSLEKYGRSPDALENIFKKCAITRDMHGNWRTRDGKVHWCSCSQRGGELGYIPADSNDYVDLFDNTYIAEKRAKFETIADARYISACDYCSGLFGTTDETKRHSAARQEIK